MKNTGERKLFQKFLKMADSKSSFFDSVVIENEYGQHLQVMLKNQKNLIQGEKKRKRGGGKNTLNCQSLF
jgi:hypothetical protein